MTLVHWFYKKSSSRNQVTGLNKTDRLQVITIDKLDGPIRDAQPDEELVKRFVEDLGLVEPGWLAGSGKS